MATIKDLQELMARSGIAPDTVTMIITEMRVAFAGDKIYVPAPDHSKKELIKAALRTMPSGVVAERYGVTQSYTCRVARKLGKN